MDDKISVAMATYNGERYIEEQINTILNNLKENDELIISDDGSNDKTVDIIKKYIEKDKRVKLFNGPQCGLKQNFANAINNTSGKYIFLSDQDDIWMQNKVEKVIQCFKNQNATVVIHDAEIVDSNLKTIIPSFFEYRNSGKGILKNIWKNTYIGCCMAFEKSIKEKILPIPNDIEMHDQWIGILSEKYGKSVFLNEKLIKYRRHDSNVSQMHHHKLCKMIRNRIIFIKNIRRR